MAAAITLSGHTVSPPMNVINWLRLTCPSRAIIASPLLEANAWETLP